MNKDPNASGAFDMPLGELVRSMASAVVQAQTDMDRNAMMVAEMMSGQQVLRDPVSFQPIYTDDGSGKPVLKMIDSRVFFGSVMQDGKREPIRLSMLELGFTPTFYQFVETTIEIRVAIRMNQSRDEQGITTVGLLGTPVDATYSQTYNYSSDMACVFKTKLVPIPSPPLIEQRIRMLLETEKAAQAEAAQAEAQKTALLQAAVTTAAEKVEAEKVAARAATTAKTTAAAAASSKAAADKAAAALATASRKVADLTSAAQVAADKATADQAAAAAAPQDQAAADRAKASRAAADKAEAAQAAAVKSQTAKAAAAKTASDKAAADQREADKAANEKTAADRILAEKTVAAATAAALAAQTK